MKLFKLIILLAVASCTNAQSVDNQTQSKAEALDKVLHERNPNSFTFPTKFGDLKFVTADGTLGGNAESVTLNDKTLITVKGKKDAQGNIPSLMIEIMKSSSTEYEPRIVGETGRRKIKRMVVLEGVDIDCVKKFIILDFTGKQPFVSESFGYNPEDKFCMSFKYAKWGKRESYITITGPMKYIYNTGGRVFGPLE